MNNDVEVMLYVTDVDREANFWQSVGFVERDRQDMGTTEMVQMAPSEDGAFAFNIFDLALIVKGITYIRCPTLQSTSRLDWRN